MLDFIKAIEPFFTIISAIGAIATAYFVFTGLGLNRPDIWIHSTGMVSSDVGKRNRLFFVDISVNRVPPNFVIEEITIKGCKVFPEIDPGRLSEKDIERMQTSSTGSLTIHNLDRVQNLQVFFIPPENWNGIIHLVLRGSYLTRMSFGVRFRDFFSEF